ncbi:hypothetical protein QU577_27080 [Priestia megaterium]|uniref:hypothetical protein n=1 Tax=Priestia megaterium TaxID=1404 RepID=UPI0025B0E7B4|nr:hypothetical protein [Priestia megaterium]MDN3365431.1 hypothetical protein [Priestia megaterium]
MITFYTTCIVLRDFSFDRVPSIYKEQVKQEVVAAGYPEKVGVYPEETPTEEPKTDEQPLVNAE